MSCGCEDEASGALTRAGRLNAGCFCRTLDEGALLAALSENLGELAAPMLQTRPHLFSRAPVFLSAGEVAELRAVVAAIEEVARHPAYQQAALAWAPDIARRDFGRAGPSWATTSISRRRAPA
ncbi:hypothetical protein [Phenylobacterium aquaticum]|uniref:hypothetical protein n=1 Tax=Phenylobacterium aquaticum TaxID=1763816 RepID=UPI001F5C5E09|nr:hypothetical protein [Phenylobacterium aquaticum]MCI3132779.1 hypothetical protein [Phenylobacterium aquaticum]